MKLVRDIIFLGVFLCGGLQGEAHAVVASSTEQQVVFERNSPVACDSILLYVVTEVARSFDACPDSSTHAIIVEEWSALTQWLLRARARQPKDFRRRCILLRELVKQSGELDHELAQALLDALEYMLRKYQRMSWGAKVGIGISVTALAAALAVAAGMMIKSRRGTEAPAATGAVSSGSGAGSPSPDTSNEAEIAPSGQDGLSSRTQEGGAAAGEVSRTHIRAELDESGGGPWVIPDTSNDAAIARELQEAESSPTQEGGAAAGSSDQSASASLVSDSEKARRASVEDVNSDALKKLTILCNALKLLTAAYKNNDHGVIDLYTEQLAVAESAYLNLPREGDGYLQAYKRTMIQDKDNAWGHCREAKDTYKLAMRTASESRADPLSVAASVSAPATPPQSQNLDYEPPLLPEAMQDRCAEAYALYVSLDQHNPVKARAWSLYQAYRGYSDVYKPTWSEPAADSSDQARLNYERLDRIYKGRLEKAQKVVDGAQQALATAQESLLAGAGSVS
jgi:hypothetical protein